MISLSCSSGATGSDDDIAVAPAGLGEHTEAASRSTCGAASIISGAGAGSRRESCWPLSLAARGDEDEAGTEEVVLVQA